MIGFAAASDGSGAYVLPFAVGAIASATSLSSLQPVILAMAVSAVVLWALGMPTIWRREDKAGVRQKIGTAGQSV